MQSGGERLRCTACGKEYRMDELGRMQALTGETEFPHIPDWYRWQRQCVREELEQGSYRMEVNVDIYMLVDSKCVYRVGEGRLLHTTDGFHLTGCKGKLNYRQTPGASYSLYSDFFWYEMGDVICIGNHDALYYCFPKNAGDVVAKARLAAEELYRLTARQRKTDKET